MSLLLHGAKFKINPLQAVIPDNKNSSEHANMQKCFQYMFALIGFDEKETRFTTMPHKVGQSFQKVLSSLIIHFFHKEIEKK